jgi:hypothetical protein
MQELEIPEGKDYAIRNQTSEEKERLTSDTIPTYRIKLNLSEEQKDRLKTECFAEFDALVAERTSLKLESKWKALDAQYEGNGKSNDRINFNIDCGESKIKEDSIVRAIAESMLDSDPMFDISARPETQRKDGDIVAQKQAEFLDYSIDEEVKPEHELILWSRSAVRKYVGISKLCWDYSRERRKREETYEGNEEGLKQFINAYPDPSAVSGYEGYIKKLMNGQKAHIVVEYWDTIANNPRTKYVKIENFYVKNSTKGNEGLRTAHCVVEREMYTWYELEAKEQNKEFEDIKRLANSSTKDASGNIHVDKDHKTAEYNILEFTKYFKINESDKRETKIKVWFSEDKKEYLGAIFYQYYGFDIDYIAYYIKLNDKGFYGNAESVIWDLRHTHIAQNALISLALHGTYVRNILTPIVKSGSEIESIFLEKRFKDGSPLPVDGLTDDVNKALSFVQWPPMDTNSLVMLNQIVERIGSDSTSVSDLMTGRESASDPNAPAAKTIALLQQSGIGIKDYIRVYLPSFNILATNLLQLYFQMSQEGKKYQVRRKSEGVTGSNPFAMISRDEMGARMVVESRATSFAFDKMNEKQENLTAYQLLRQDPYAMQIPELQFKSLKTVLESWNPRFRNIAETDLPSPEQFKKQQMMVCVQAIQMIMAQARQNQEITGVAPEMNIESMSNDMTKQQAVAYNPMLAEEGAVK